MGDRFRSCAVFLALILGVIMADHLRAYAHEDRVKYFTRFVLQFAVDGVITGGI